MPYFSFSVTERGDSPRSLRLNQSMSQRPHCEANSACLRRHPAVRWSSWPPSRSVTSAVWNSMISPLRFPTEMHQEVAGLAGEFFSANAHVDTILVVNSCARGRAVAGSDLDLAVLITAAAASQEVQSLTTLWQKFIATQPLAIHRFRSTGRFNQVHLDVFDGRMVPSVWDDGGGPDDFEVEIGNRLAYAVPLHDAGAYFRQLQSQWLPYYRAGSPTESAGNGARGVRSGFGSHPFLPEPGLVTSRPLIAYTRRSRNSCRRSFWRDAPTRSPTTSGFASR